MSKRTNRYHARQRRHRRLRNKISGTSARPRLNVYRSSAHIYAQLIDDDMGVTLVSVSTNDRTLRDQLASVRPLEQAHRVGTVLAARARDRGVTRVVFDRGGFQFHGRIKALATGSRAGGLQF